MIIHFLLSSLNLIGVIGAIAVLLIVVSAIVVIIVIVIVCIIKRNRRKGVPEGNNQLLWYKATHSISAFVKQ